MALYNKLDNVSEINETLQAPGAFNSDTRVRTEKNLKGKVFGLCLSSCYGEGGLECPYHSRNPGCEIAEILLGQYRIFLLLRRNGHL